MDEAYDDGDNCQSLTHGNIPEIKRFNYIFSVGVNNKVLPNGVRSDFSDDVSLKEFETGEKCLLYVALTRARAGAYVTCYGTMSNLIM